MVRDGYYYGLTFIAAGILLGWLTRPVWAIFPFLFGAFFMQFFRDPERVIPDEPGAVVSPGDGKVTDVVVGNDKRLRISIFLNVFNVHVNRSPNFRCVARGEICARQVCECNERSLGRSE